MDVLEFEEILAFGREQQGVEFKGRGSKKDRILFAKVVRAVISMANRQDGGLVIIGVDEDDIKEPRPTGMSDEEVQTWNYDGFADSLARYVDPYVNFDLEVLEWNGTKFVIIRVHEFDDIPILCKQDYQNVLREGACYVRTRRKPETAEIPTQTEMRELLGLAIIKGIRKFMTQAHSAGITTSPQLLVTDEDLFDKQIDDLLR